MNGLTEDWVVACDYKPTMPWACFGRYKMETYDRPGVCLRLKVRMLKAEVMETLLCECVTWSPSKADYDRLRNVHHQMFLRCLGWRKRKREDHILSLSLIHI